jgi:hypothetical protein
MASDFYLYLNSCMDWLRKIINAKTLVVDIEIQSINLHNVSVYEDK